MNAIYQLQPHHLKKVSGCHSPQEELYDVNVRCIATLDIKDNADSRRNADDAWHAVNVTEWHRGYNPGDQVEVDTLTAYPTEFFEGYCGSDVYVVTKGKIFVADSCGWTVVRSIEEAWWHILYYSPEFYWDCIHNQEAFNPDGFDLYCRKQKAAEQASKRWRMQKSIAKMENRLAKLKTQK